MNLGVRRHEVRGRHLHYCHFDVVPSSLAAKCKVVAGVFQLRNGWPPSLRLTDSKSGAVCGAYEHTLLPRGMRQEITNNAHIKGKFCLKVFGRTTVPTQKQPTVLVRVMPCSR